MVVNNISNICKITIKLVNMFSILPFTDCIPNHVKCLNICCITKNHSVSFIIKMLLNILFTPFTKSGIVNCLYKRTLIDDFFYLSEVSY